MKFVMEAIREQEAKEKEPVIKLEIDYELATLHDAMIVDDRIQMIKSKERLKTLCRQLTSFKDT
ncbi:hypothetical protein JNUCC1_00065 [Lentibacillus sp. JNUCC-1]|uniref:hypothetical protein n=1 Tax=Lentibacillus sp. JNUCC-1 TaxID=2654513 RepID=UPI0012E76883|nr:hypothetical protein [Lentibacillus sp. JNUCC-1]MUV36264.1 hypothetical protein [Lentibacillus sp. JNUCC-1]